MKRCTGKCGLITICVVQLVATLEREVFDFLGYMWLPIIANFLQLVAVIFGFFGAYQNRIKYLIVCDDSAEQLCVEECVEHKDVLEAAGGWSARVPEHHHPGNLTVGDIGCMNLGRDETGGIFPQLYHAICDRPTKWTGPALREPLCCDDGKYVRCY